MLERWTSGLWPPIEMLERWTSDLCPPHRDSVEMDQWFMAPLQRCWRDESLVSYSDAGKMDQWFMASSEDLSLIPSTH